jgi:hypothetical protein
MIVWQRLRVNNGESSCVSCVSCVCVCGCVCVCMFCALRGKSQLGTDSRLIAIRRTIRRVQVASLTRLSLWHTRRSSLLYVNNGIGFSLGEMRRGCESANREEPTNRRE